MFRIVRRSRYGEQPTAWAPRVAHSAPARQFVIVRTDARRTRPLTIADYDTADGTVTIVLQTIGMSTRKMYGRGRCAG